MTDMTQAKLAAAGKIALGGGKMAGAISTAVGHGLVGSWLRNHNMVNVGAHLAKRSFASGKELLEEGLRDWKKANS